MAVNAKDKHFNEMWVSKKNKIAGREVLIQSLVGSQNYNLNTAESDKDYKIFVMPNFEDLYYGKKYQTDILTTEADYSVHDIRKLVDLLFKSNINYVEALASKSIMTSSYHDELDEIVRLRHEIFNMNLSNFFQSCYGMHKQKMGLLGKGTEGTQHLVDQFGYDTKQALHSYRIMKVIVDYEASGFTDMDSAIRYDVGSEDHEFLMSIRNGFFKREVFENFTEHYRDSTFLKVGEKYLSQPVNLELKEHLDDLVMKMIEKNIKK